MHLLMQHRVEGDAVLEIEVALLVRQIAVKQDVAGFQVRAVLGKPLNGIAAIKENSPVAVGKGDVGFATRSRGKPGIVGESARQAVSFGMSITFSPLVPLMTGNSYCLPCKVSVAKSALASSVLACGLCVDRSSCSPPAGTHGDPDTKGGRTLTKFRPLIPQKQACVPNEQTAAFGLLGGFRPGNASKCWGSRETLLSASRMA